MYPREEDIFTAEIFKGIILPGKPVREKNLEKVFTLQNSEELP
jgi:purine-nucleoside phosphorylase